MAVVGGRDDAVRVLIADPASLAVIRKVADEVLGSEARLDVFVHSGGVLAWERRECGNVMSRRRFVLEPPVRCLPAW